MEGPIRGGAAIDGARCFEEHVALDVFVRSPIGEGVGAGSGGSLENIDRLLDNGTPGTPACGVLVTDQWILTSNGRETGRAACGERVGQAADIEVVDVPCNKKK